MSALAPGNEAAAVTVFARRFIPNSLVPTFGVPCVALPGIVLAPDVSVGPFTVITYPVAAFVLAAICEVAVAVSVGLNNWLNEISPDVELVQLMLTVAPVQKMIDSGMIPVRTICVAVLAVTTPLSTGPVEPSVPVYVVIRTKNDVLVADGLVTLSSLYVTACGPVIFDAVRVIYGAPLVVLTKEKPVAPVSVPSVALVVTSPVGIVQVPAAVVQYWNLIDPILLLLGAGIVKLNRCRTTPLGFDPPSVAPACKVSVRGVI
jgi:hypothetical protein